MPAETVLLFSLWPAALVFVPTAAVHPLLPPSPPRRLCQALLCASSPRTPLRSVLPHTFVARHRIPRRRRAAASRRRGAAPRVASASLVARAPRCVASVY